MFTISRDTVLRVFVIALAVAGSSICANATTTTINFSSLSQPGTGSYDETFSYTQNGFTFADVGGSGFAVWEASSPNLPGGATANTSLFESSASSTTSLTDGGNLFAITSIDLAPYNIQQTVPTFDVTFQGYLAGIPKYPRHSL